MIMSQLVRTLRINIQEWLRYSQLKRFSGGQVNALLKKSLLKLSSFFFVLSIAASLNAQEVWIDVRSVAEHQRDHISGHLHIPITRFEQSLGSIAIDKRDTVFLYCAAGVRAEKARQILLDQGYEQVKNVGGLDDARRLLNHQTTEQ